MAFGRKKGPQGDLERPATNAWGERVPPDGSGTNVWGEPIDDPTPAERAVGAFNSRMAGMEPRARSRRFALLAAAGIALALAALALAGMATCSVTERSADVAAQRQAESAADDEQEESSPIDAEKAKRFANLDAYTHLSDESKELFIEDFDAYLDSRGVSSAALAMCYSKIETVDGKQVSYASCPHGEDFYKVTFDPSSRTFSFEPCDLPEGLPEINYEARARLEGAEPVHSSGTAVESSDQTAVDSRTAVSAVLVTDTAGLSGHMPAEAASLLAEAVSGFSAAKGMTADLSNCWVPIGSFAGDASAPSMEVQCQDASGKSWVISAEWSPRSGQFGMSLKQ